MMSITNDDAILLKNLIEKGADVNYHYVNTSQGEEIRNYPIHEALSKKNREIIQILLEKGADPNSYILL